MSVMCCDHVTLDFKISCLYIVLSIKIWHRLSMKKRPLLHALIVEMEKDLRLLQAANKDASAGATHSESRAETKWDTCGLESSYLARGHAQKFKELASNVLHLRSMTLPVYENQPIGLGAFIEVFLGQWIVGRNYQCFKCLNFKFV